MEGYNDACFTGWESICIELKRAFPGFSSEKLVVTIECYSGIIDREVIPALAKGLSPDQFIQTEKDVFKSSEEINSLLTSYLSGDDPIFGRMNPLALIDYLDSEKRTDVQQSTKAAEALTIVYGPGALLCCEPDIVVYADMARWEAQMRQRANKISNLSVDNRQLKASLQYKRSYFIDWRACDKLKRATFDQWDYFLDTCVEGEPNSLLVMRFEQA